MFSLYLLDLRVLMVVAHWTVVLAVVALLFVYLMILGVRWPDMLTSFGCYLLIVGPYTRL